MADLELRRGLPVPVERVWHAFTDPDALAGWFWPARFQTSVSNDLRVGGRYRIDGSAGGLAVSGEYLELVEPRRLRFGWQWDGDVEVTEVSLAMRASGHATVLLLRHTGFADDASRDRHDLGWSDCLERLPGWLLAGAR
jgi:uncharacterized protein YndB with AHSA1/START domain